MKSEGRRRRISLAKSAAASLMAAALAEERSVSLKNWLSKSRSEMLAQWPCRREGENRLSKWPVSAESYLKCENNING